MSSSPSEHTEATSVLSLPDFEYAAGAMGSAARRYLAATREAIQAQFDPRSDVTPLLRASSQAVDRVLTALWSAHITGHEGLSLLAVGGYGRGELFPHSDIDILILLCSDPDPDVASTLEHFVTGLWDIGLQIGHSVRTLGECDELAREDLTIVTTMMESRLLIGDPSLADRLREIISVERMWPKDEFIRGKLSEQSARHDKFSNTEYALEPNVKSSPGGLRDLQVIEWLALRYFGQGLEAIDQPDFLNSEELSQLSDGKRFLSQVRFALHMLSGRAEDRLLFDHQKQLAALWGMTDSDTLAVEQFMQTYYRYMQSLSQLNELLIELFEHSLSKASDNVRVVDDDFEVSDGRIRARHKQVFSDNPSNLLRLFVIIGNDQLVDRIEPNTQRLLRRDAHLIDDAFRASPENRALFLAVLNVPHGMTKQLRRMLRHGVLGRYLPAFGQIVGQMQFDLFHAYTVDAHTAEVIANTRRFMRADYTDRFPVSTRIARRLRSPLLLYIAALFHDIGKGRGGDHSELGAEDARQFCRDHGLDQTDTDLVVWLVKNHLLMSYVAQRRDISDPDEILRFAEIVGSEERLDYLYTLTVADIAGTNPELWNAWRSSLMRQLYTEARRALIRGLGNPLGRAEVIRTTRLAASDLLEYRGFLEVDLDDMWAQRGDDYFLRERAEDIAWHTEAIADHHDRSRPLVLVKQASESPIGNATQIFVHTPDEPNTFARICAELETLDLSIHDARIYSDRQGATLDTFFVLKSDGSSLDNRPETFLEIKLALEKCLANPTLKAVTRHTPRTVRAFVIPTEVTFSEDEVGELSILEIVTADRPGLLARLGSVLSRYELSIQGAKIQTLGERVEDVFFLSDRSGGPLTDASVREHIRSDIIKELDQALEAAV